MADKKYLDGDGVAQVWAAVKQHVADEGENKADIDGYYSQLTAGLAENLIGRGDAVPAEYLYRTAGGTADIEDGIATIDCIKGNTLVWNQYVKNESAVWTAMSGTKSYADGVITITPNDGDGFSYCQAFQNLDTSGIGGRKYLVSMDFLKEDWSDSAQNSNYAFPTLFGSWLSYYPSLVPSKSVTTWQHLSGIVSQELDNASRGFTFRSYGNTYPFSIKNVMVIDLTAMFGSGNEPSTVAEFEAMFPLPYYPYSAPKLLPVDIRGIETVGFNQFDKDAIGILTDKYLTSNGTITSIGGGSAVSDYIGIIGGQTYYLSKMVSSSVSRYCCWYDGSKGFISSFQTPASATTVDAPANARYLRVTFGTSLRESICINLTWSGYRNGEYEEHWSAERPIDTSRFFPTGMKKAGDKADALYADHYDTVIGAVDLGTLTWLSATASDITYFYANFSSVPETPLPTLPATISDVANIKCGLYTTIKNSMVVATDKSMSLASNTARVFIHDSAYTDAAAFKAAMSGVILYYELATPTTTEIDHPLNLSYKVSDFGTERIMVDETADAPQSAPVPMEVEYGINAIDTIRRLPTEYQSHKSMGQFAGALESSLGIDITETWDEDDQRYEYEVSDFEIADNSIPDAKLAQTGGVLSKVEVASVRCAASGSTTIVDLTDGGIVSEVIAELLPNQSGSGTPSPSNYRAITARNNLLLSVNGQEVSTQAPSDFYGGTWNVLTGEVSSDIGFRQITSSTTITVASKQTSVCSFNTFVPSTDRVGRHVISSLLETLPQGNVSVIQKPYTIGNRTDSGGVQFSVAADLFGNDYSTMTNDELVTAIKVWIDQMNANGTPFTIAYHKATPTTEQAAALTVSAVAGNNTFSVGNGTVSVNYYANTKRYVDKRLLENDAYYTGNVRGIAHRGYSYAAPENTVAAFKLAKFVGFDAIETDIGFSSDGYAVCIHDSTVNRTSNGTGNVADMTLAELRMLDFGSWKSEQFAGEKIPTFEEFLQVCKQCGLDGYVELKADVNNTSERMAALVATVKRYGLSDKITWISFDETFLYRIQVADASARLGLVNGGAGDAVLQRAIQLKTSANEVFVDAGSLESADIDDYIANGVDLEWWTVDSIEQMASANPYISGITSNRYSASRVIPDYALGSVKAFV